MPTARLSLEVELTCPVDTDYEKSRGLREKRVYGLTNKFCVLRATWCFPQFISFSLYVSVVSSLWSLIKIWHRCRQDGRGKDF